MWGRWSATILSIFMMTVMLGSIIAVTMPYKLSDIISTESESLPIMLPSAEAAVSPLKNIRNYQFLSTPVLSAHGLLEESISAMKSLMQAREPSAKMLHPEEERKRGIGAVSRSPPQSSTSVVSLAPVGDPIGDTFGGFGVQLDITSIDAEYGPTTLDVTVTFADTISPFSAFLPNSVGGFIDVDADQDPTTGTIFTFFDGIGVDLFINLFSELGGMVLIIDQFGAVADVPIAFTATSFTVNVPLCLFSGGNFNYGVDIFNSDFERTDVAPNAGVATSSGILPTCNPSVFDLPPTPAAGTVFLVPEGGSISFDLQASDPDLGDIVTISGDLPFGAILTSTPDNPATATFEWTPSEGNVGSFVTTFVATDDVGFDSAPHPIFIDVAGGHFGTDVVVDSNSEPFQRSEVAITANPTDTNNLVAVSHRISDPGGFGSVTCAFYTSFDMGATWNEGILPQITNLSGDPTITSDSTGKHFYACLDLDSDGDGDNPLFVSSSIDGGTNWTTVVAVPEQNDGFGLPIFHDKPWIAADKNPASPCTNNVYISYTDFFDALSPNAGSSPIMFVRSTDGGATWTPPIEISIPGTGNQFSYPFVDPITGDVYVVWYDLTFDPPNEIEPVRLARSTDCGATFGPVQTVDPITDAFFTFFDFIDDEQFIGRSPAQVQGCVDGLGWIHVAYTVSDTIGSDTDISYRSSTTAQEGQTGTWNGPFVVNDVTEQDQFFPATDCKDETTHITWGDQRNSSVNQPHTFDIWYTQTSDRGQTFVEQQRVNDVTQDVRNGIGNGFEPVVGDYFDLVVGNDAVHTVWTGGFELASTPPFTAGSVVSDIITISEFGFGPSFLANGTNFLDEPDKPDLRLQEFSLASWFKTSHNAVGANAMIVNKGGLGAGENRNYGLFLNWGERLVGGFESRDGKNHFVTSPNSYDNGNAQYAVVTYDLSIIKLYVNGSIVATLSTSAIPDDGSSRPVRIAANSAAENEFFNGSIDEVRIWNRPLTDQEVSDQYNSAIFDTAGQVLYRDMSEFAVNNPPVADAGPDQTVIDGLLVTLDGTDSLLVTLDGTGSSDPDGDTLTYSWTQTSGTTVTLSDATITNPTFVAPTTGNDVRFLTGS